MPFTSTPELENMRNSFLACSPTGLHVAIALALGCSSAAALAGDVAPELREQAVREGKVDALIVLAAKAPKHLLRDDDNYLARRRALVETLRATAEVSQAPLRGWLDANGVSHRPYWIVNMIQAELTPAQLDVLGQRTDIAGISANAQTRRVPDTRVEPLPPREVLAAEWGINKIGAPAVWAAGITGAGVIVSGQDTGIRWTHNAIRAKYRGWNGTSADHNYNWHDAIHGDGNAACPGDQVAPCDDNGHGTHTIGTMVGDDGSTNQIGVAPGAKFIGCRNMNGGDGRPSYYNECAQWFLAPTDLEGENPNPDLAPDVIGNSWGCPPAETCTTGDEVREAIENLVDGGIFFAAAAGNGGSGCSTIVDPPGIYDASFVVGSTTSTDALSSFSARGPVAGAARIRPDISAPGSSVRSSTSGSDSAYGNSSGTSMATPHVAGAAALLMQANPNLKGNPAAVAEILRSTAATVGIATANTQTCGATAVTTWPNYMAGHGRLDVWQAFRKAESIFDDAFGGD